jgi:UDP-glucose 4-epimerase
MASVLLTGAAGFIGSITADLMAAQGITVVALDDERGGHPLIGGEGIIPVVGSVDDVPLVRDLVHEHAIDACVHFAGSLSAGESMEIPERYFVNNTAASLVLLETLIDAQVRDVVFSSSATVYGEPTYLPLDEDHPLSSTNVYGETKLAIERAGEWLARQGRLRFAALRYFNAAGGTPGRVEDHQPETHLIPLALAAAAGHRPALSLYGTDYPTADGTCIRDYVHVADLAVAHIQALEALRAGRTHLVVNLGTGTGYSNRQVLEMIAEVTGRVVPVVETERRPGDAAATYASRERAASLLGWEPTRSDLRTIIEDAWAGYQATHAIS